MDSILSSASMLMAAISLIYSFYQKEITEAQEYKIPLQFTMAKPKYNAIKKLANKKLLPLIIFTGVIILVYLPPVIVVIAQSITLWTSPDTPNQYAPNLAALVIIEVFLVYLFVIFLGILKELRQILQNINKLSKQNNN